MEMILNLRQLTLSFVVNGTDFWVAFDGVSTKTTYRAVVSMNRANDAIELISYEAK